MKVVDSEKVISLLEQIKRYLPDRSGICPKKFFDRAYMDEVIQHIRASSIEFNISEKGEVKMSQIEKRLGKIDFAEFGILKDYPFLIGLHLGFSMGGCGVMDGGQYTVNISSECCWKDVSREVAVTSMVEKVNQILSDAKACYVSDLVNKPVEVTLENRCFKSFRILTEVL